MFKKIMKLLTIASIKSRGADFDGQPEALGDPERVKREEAHRKFEETRKNSANTPSSKESEFNAEEEARKILKENIRSSLQGKRVKLLYSPIFDANVKTPLFHDVITHLLDKDLMVIEPKSYVPIVQGSGLSSWLDQVILSSILTEQQDSFDVFCMPLTKDTLEKSMEFFEVLMMESMEIGFSAERLLFELKFHNIDNEGHTLNFMKEAKAMQFKFILDYVGGGAKVVKMIKQLGFNYIKIDCLRFNRIFGNDSSELDEIIKAAKECNIELIAEKVSTKEVYEACKGAGIKYIKGSILAKPEATLTTSFNILS